VYPVATAAGLFLYGAAIYKAYMEGGMAGTPFRKMGEL
jgi:hypothetical protein